MRDSLGEVDRDGRTRGKRLREAQIGVREAGIGPKLVVSRQHTDRPSPDEQRHPEACASAEQTHRLVVDVGVVQDRVDTLALATFEDAPALRGRAGDRRGGELGLVAGHRREAQFVLAAREQDEDEPGVEQLPQPAGDQVEQPAEVGFRRERVPDLVQGLELLRPSGRGFV